MPSGKGVYLFCFARSNLLPGELGINGLEEGSSLLQYRDRDLAAVLSEVSLEEFTGPGSEARLRELGWIAPRALRHQAVIEHINRFSPVFPARFGTIFSSREALQGLLSRYRERILDFLTLTSQAQEWGLKGFLDRRTAQEQVVETDLASTRTLSPGMRYMQERKLRAQAEARVRRWLEETAAEAKGELAQEATEVVERNIHSASLGESPGEMVLNWAFLVPVSRVDHFRATATRMDRELRPTGLTFEIVGPFPPYSFTPQLEESHS